MSLPAHRPIAQATSAASPDDILSAPDSKAVRLQRAWLELLREPHRNGDIPSNGRFLFYKLEQRGVIPAFTNWPALAIDYAITRDDPDGIPVLPFSENYD